MNKNHDPQKIMAEKVLKEDRGEGTFSPHKMKLWELELFYWVYLYRDGFSFNFSNGEIKIENGNI